MGRKSTGTVRLLRNEDGELQWHAKYTLVNGSRGDWEALNPAIATDKPSAKAEAARMAPKVRLRSATGSAVETVEQYAKRWLADRDGRVNSIRDDRSRIRDHVVPTLGPLDASKFTRDDVERLRDVLDEKIVAGELAWKTVASVWTLVTSMCSDMVNAKKRELRTRQDNPCTDVKPPERGSRKAKQYMYPSELLAFVSCPDVPQRWRRAAALAVYLFPRDGELQALSWDDVDLEHGVLSITKALNARTGVVESTKTGETRRFAIEPALLPLLQAMHDQADGKGAVVGWHEPHMSRGLRRWLKVARIDRAALHEGTPTQKPLTWHDLRATGATWMAVRGDDPLKIKQRCGHSTFSTTEIYIREAEAVRDGFGEVFPALPESLLGIAPISPRAIVFSRSSQKQGTPGAGHGSRTRAENTHETVEIQPDRAPSSETVSPRLDTVADEPRPRETARGAKALDADEADLERRMVDAELAGRKTVADALSRRLDALRAAHAGGNVVPLRRGGRS